MGFGVQFGSRFFFMTWQLIRGDEKDTNFWQKVEVFWWLS